MNIPTELPDAPEVVITPAMIEAGNLAADRILTAGVAESMNGLGGSMKAAEAPPEISQYFARTESSVVLMFQAMDAVSPTPFAQPVTEGMEKAGSDMLALMFDVTMLRHMQKRDPEFNLADLTQDELALFDNQNPPVYLMYQAMMQHAQTNTAENPAQGNPMKKQVSFTNIDWDTDGDGADLPSEVVLEVSFDDETDLDSQGADILSDKYGFCVLSFDFEVLEAA